MFFNWFRMLKNEKKNFLFSMMLAIDRQFCSVSIPDYKNVICLLATTRMNNSPVFLD